jgi:phosphoglycolate phosphatase
VGGIKGILFDKDGTLIDFDRTWFEVADLMALKAANGSRSRADHLLIEAGYDFGTRRFKADSVFAAGTNADVIALWYPGQSPAERQATVEDYDRFVGENASAKPYGLPGVKDAITKLHGLGYRMGVATNDSTRGAERTLAALGMSQLFDAAYGYDAVANPKPAPDTVRAFCDLTGYKPSEVAMVGDNRHDMDMARSAGVLARPRILFRCGKRPNFATMSRCSTANFSFLPAS